MSPLRIVDQWHPWDSAQDVARVAHAYREAMWELDAHPPEHTYKRFAKHEPCAPDVDVYVVKHAGHPDEAIRLCNVVVFAEDTFDAVRGALRADLPFPKEPHAVAMKQLARLVDEFLFYDARQNLRGLVAPLSIMDAFGRLQLPRPDFRAVVATHCERFPAQWKATPRGPVLETCYMARAGGVFVAS